MSSPVRNVKQGFGSIMTLMSNLDRLVPVEGADGLGSCRDPVASPGREMGVGFRPHSNDPNHLPVRVVRLASVVPYRALIDADVASS